MEWENVSIYGRQDPIQSYKSTGETISLTFPLLEGVDYGTKKGIAAGTTSLQSLNIILLRLSKLCRPIYQAGVIKQSPLISVTVGADTSDLRSTKVGGAQQFGGAPYIIAPTSLSIDFGDRARTISAFISGGGRRSTDVTKEKGGGEIKTVVVPTKCLVTLSGAILYPDRRYVTLAAQSGADDSNDPSANAMKKKAAAAKSAAEPSTDGK